MRTPSLFPLLAVPLLAVPLYACSSSEGGDGITCGEGTSLVKGQCVPATTGLGGRGGSAGSGAGAGGSSGRAGGAGTAGKSGMGGLSGGAGGQLGGGAGGAAASAGGSGGNAGTSPGGQGGVGGGSQGGSSGAGASPGGAGAAGKAGGGSGASAPVFAGVSAVAPSSTTSLFVTWKPATDDISPSARISYRIYLAAKAGAQDFSKPTGTAPPGSTSAELFLGIVADTEYFAVVRAVDEAGNADANSVEKSARTKADDAPPTFAGVTKASTAGPAAVQLAWEPATDLLTPSAGIVYYVYGSQTAGKKVFDKLLGVSDPGATGFLVRGLPDDDKPTFFGVRARDGAGNVEANTKQVSAVPGKDTTAPSFAGCAAAVSNATGGIDVLWAPAADDGTLEGGIGYEVYLATVPELQDFTKPPEAKVQGGTQVTVSGLAPSTEYFVVCRARDASGNQDANRSQKSATTPADAKPPTFQGVQGVANASTTMLDLVWTPATDDTTDPEEIVYDIYQSLTSGGQAFGAPTVTSAPGASSVTVNGLATGKRYYFVVRARDLAGNRDQNGVEIAGTTAISFKKNVQPILTSSCAAQGCHSSDAPQSGLTLSPGSAYGQTVNVISTEAAPQKRVQPGSPLASYLFLKIIDAPGIVPSAMPPVGSKQLTAAEKSTIETWIAEGAMDN